MDALPNAKVSPVMPTQKVDNAAGVNKACLIVAIVNNKAEWKYAQKLENLGYECYVPTQSELHIWRTCIEKVVDRIVLPSMIFIHTTETEHKQRIVTLPYINSFMPNRASAKDTYGRSPVAIIPDNQIQRLKFILGNADAPVEFEPTTFKLGDKVRVIRGGLTGAEGHIVECGDGAYFAIQVDFLGVAKARVNKDNIEIIQKK